MDWRRKDEIAEGLPNIEGAIPCQQFTPHCVLDIGT
jgi:hypothetical protein